LPNPEIIFCQILKLYFAKSWNIIQPNLGIIFCQILELYFAKSWNYILPNLGIIFSLDFWCDCHIKVAILMKYGHEALLHLASGSVVGFWLCGTIKDSILF
jgi:hypothetical protein